MSLNITCEDNMALMARLKDESVDIICIDPPYLYLKNQKLERVFDEQKFFSECWRLLTDDGFIVMFGRGESFYRWNTILSNIGFNFKEEIIWDKQYCSSSLLAISRRHETISIFCKGKASINKVKIPYLEMKMGDISSILTDLKRLISGLKNLITLPKVIEYLETKIIKYDLKSTNNYDLSGEKKGLDQAVSSIVMIEEGMTEKSIIRVVRDHYTSIHPTQKPVRLIERLLSLVVPDKPYHEITVADFFGGSMSTMEAVYNMGMNGIACELDPDYYAAAMKRIEKHTQQSKLFF